MFGSREHWDAVYGSKPATEVSWYEDFPDTSLRLIEQATGSAILDVGAGASYLADRLLDRGCRDLTLLDVSSEALAVVQQRLRNSPEVTYVATDLLAWTPERHFDVWHDRAVFHFLTNDAEVERYVETASAAVRSGGALILGAFASDGPTHCSGLPTARYDAGALAARFHPWFAEEHREREEHRTPSGPVQPFTWVVLR